MKRNIAKIILAAFFFISIPCSCYAYANSVEVPEINIRSYGNIVYEDENGSVKIYAEDIAFLQEKLSSIPKEIFDPAMYSHVHERKYIDVIDQEKDGSISLNNLEIQN